MENFAKEIADHQAAEKSAAAKTYLEILHRRVDGQALPEDAGAAIRCCHVLERDLAWIADDAKKILNHRQAQARLLAESDRLKLLHVEDAANKNYEAVKVEADERIRAARAVRDAASSSRSAAVGRSENARQEIRELEVLNPILFPGGAAAGPLPVTPHHRVILDPSQLAEDDPRRIEALPVPSPARSNITFDESALPENDPRRTKQMPATIRA